MFYLLMSTFIIDYIIYKKIIQKTNSKIEKLATGKFKLILVYGSTQTALLGKQFTPTFTFCFSLVSLLALGYHLRYLTFETDSLYHVTRAWLVLGTLLSASMRAKIAAACTTATQLRLYYS